MVRLPLIASEPNYRVATVLDSVTYLFDVRWNTRDEAWYFDLYQADETLLIAGVKIVLGTLIMNRETDASMPPGYFLASDLSGAGIDATLDDMGVRVVVDYITTADAAAAF